MGHSFRTSPITNHALGYHTTIRTKSTEALELFRSGPDPFDLVITDMTMPTMTGDKLSTELMKINPKIPIIMCTGYSNNISEQLAEEIGIKAFLLKSVAGKDLALKVREVLDNQKRSGAGPRQAAKLSNKGGISSFLPVTILEVIR